MMPHFARKMIVSLFLSHAFALYFPLKGCTEVPESKCGTDWNDSCLQCGTKYDYDCEKCCPNCQPIQKDNYRYCDCGKAPTPPPGPPSGNDTWDHYQIAGMDVISVTGGKDATAYEKVTILLHGGGEDGTMWQKMYESGWFGNMTGLKYVFPTSAYSGHVWYQDYKNGCGLLDDCAYNLSSIAESASWIADLIQHEKAMVSDGSKVYLAGFSQGAQMTGYMQLAKLDFALGGVIVMDGFPLPPLVDMPGHSSSDAKKNATYYGNDMKWMIWHGDADTIFPVDLTMNTWHSIFDVLEISSTLKIAHREPDMPHMIIQSEFEQMVDFVRAETLKKRVVLNRQLL